MSATKGGGSGAEWRPHGTATHEYDTSRFPVAHIVSSWYRRVDRNETPFLAAALRANNAVVDAWRRVVEALAHADGTITALEATHAWIVFLEGHQARAARRTCLPLPPDGTDAEGGALPLPPSPVHTVLTEALPLEATVRAWGDRVLAASVTELYARRHVLHYTWNRTARWVEMWYEREKWAHVYGAAASPLEWVRGRSRHPHLFRPLSTSDFHPLWTPDQARDMHAKVMPVLNLCMRAPPDMLEDTTTKCTVAQIKALFHHPPPPTARPYTAEVLQCRNADVETWLRDVVTPLAARDADGTLSAAGAALAWNVWEEGVGVRRFCRACTAGEVVPVPEATARAIAAFLQATPVGGAGARAAPAEEEEGEGGEPSPPTLHALGPMFVCALRELLTTHIKAWRARYLLAEVFSEEDPLAWVDAAQKRPTAYARATQAFPAWFRDVDVHDCIHGKVTAVMEGLPCG